MSITIKKRPIISQAEFDDSVPKLLQNLYRSRGVESQAELDFSLKNLIDYKLLKNIDSAITVLYSHLKKQNKILIIGDFDADGATSTSVAVSGLKQLGAENINYLVPNRFHYGYGLTPEIVDVAAKWKPDLIITVDNGIASIDGCLRAKELNIEVLVTDHHLAGDELPDAAAIVNPNQPGCNFPSKNLAGVGVIFYVMLALRNKCREENWFENNNIKEPNLGRLLDLVALGTIADVVPLDSNNRLLVSQGLKRIRAGVARPGLNALLQISGKNYSQLVSSDLGFAIGPRLNAAGRLDDMSLGIDCLLCENFDKALELAQELDSLNQERKIIESDMKDQALLDLKKISLDKASMPTGLCLFNPEWHQGVIGILASRIKDKFYRPVIAFAKDKNGFIKGSARSIQGFHIRDGLDAIAKKHPELISKFGGHAMAAGLSILEKDFERFSAEFNKIVLELLPPENLEQVIYSDGNLKAGELSIETAELIRDNGPWGQCFPEPVFDGEFILRDQKLINNKHIKLWLSPIDSDLIIEGIAFNISPNHWPNYHCEKIHAAYQLDINYFRGNKTCQLLFRQLNPIGVSHVTHPV